MRQQSVICHTFSTSSCFCSSSSSIVKNMNRSSDDDSHYTLSGQVVSPSISSFSSTTSSITVNNKSPLSSLHSIYNRQQPVLKSLFDSTRRVTSLLLVTLFLLNVAHVSDAKPYASKRLSFGEVRDTNTHKCINNFFFIFYLFRFIFFNNLSNRVV